MKLKFGTLGAALPALNTGRDLALDWGLLSGNRGAVSREACL
jgi:hypothetical protein